MKQRNPLRNLSVLRAFAVKDLLFVVGMLQFVDNTFKFQIEIIFLNVKK